MLTRALFSSSRVRISRNCRVLRRFCTAQQPDQKIVESSVGPEEAKLAGDAILNWKRATQQEEKVSTPADTLVVASNVGENFDLSGLRNYLLRFKFSPTFVNSKEQTPYLSLQIDSSSPLKPNDPSASYFMLWRGQDKQIFWFADGTFVGWGINEMDLASLDILNRTFCPQKDLLAISEQMRFSVGEQVRVDTENQTIVLSEDTQAGKTVLSIALARSVKLRKIENDIEHSIREINQPTESNLFKYNLAKNKLQDLSQLRHKLACGRFVKFSSAIPEKDHLFQTLKTQFGFNNRIQYAQNKLIFPQEYWKIERSQYEQETRVRIERLLLLIILIQFVLLLLTKRFSSRLVTIAKSKKWQDFTIEEFFSTKWKKLLSFLGVSTLPEGVYEVIIQETYEVVPKEDKKI